MGDLKRPATPGRVRAAARSDRLRLILLPFVSLAGVSTPAFADTTITDDRTTSVDTATVNNGAADNIIIGADGSITLNAPGAAVTINSNNTVTNSGAGGSGGLLSVDDSGTRGVLIQGGFTGAFTNSGVIRLSETTPADPDTDDDGDADGQLALTDDRVGVLLQGPGAFTGAIKTNAGSIIEIKGNNSAGIRLDTNLIGNVESLGSITVTGNNAVGVDINAPVTGNVLLGGSIASLGANAVGVDISGDVSGVVRFNGAVGATGFRYGQTLPSGVTLEELDADDKLIGGPAIAVRANVAGGVVIDGVGVENDNDDDRDGIQEPGSIDNSEADNDTDDNSTATITSFGSGPAVSVSTNGSDIALGPAAGLDGFGFVNRGAVSASGVFDAIEATAVRIEGLTGSQVTIAGGVLNDGVIGATARKADATALYVGTGVHAPVIRTRNRITSLSTSEEADTAYGVRVGSGADVDAFENAGLIEAQIAGDEGRSFGFIDESGGVATIVNTGTIFASSNPGNGVTFTGETVAIDVSANTTGVTLTQQGQGDFTDQDATDDAAEPAVQIIGDIRFGTGADTMNVLTGQTFGAISFGAGADSLFIDGGALVAAHLSDSDGQLSIEVQDGTLAASGDGAPINITQATFGAESTLVVNLSSDPSESTLINASGVVSFADGALVTPILIQGLPEDDTVVFLQAGSLVGGENVARILTGAENVPWVYNVEIAVSGSNPNALEASYTLKTVDQLFAPGELNQRAAFSPVIAALRQENAAAVAFGKLDSEAEFDEAFNSLLPNFSAATTELAITAIAEGQSATSNRLATARMNRLDHDSVWLQEIGFAVQRDAPDFGIDYEGHGFGFAAGFDGPLADGLLLGLSIAFTATEAEEDAREGNVTAAIGQLNAYFGGGLGPLEWDLIGGGGIGKMNSRREVRIGSDFAATSEGDWLMYEGHGQAQLGLPLRLGDRFTIRPRASIVYVGLNEEAYEEEGGGAAVDVAVGESTMQRVWADGVIDLSWRMGGAAGVTPRLTFGYRTNIIDDPAEREVRFAHASASSFTLVDEILGDGGALFGFSVAGGNEHSTVSIMYEGEFSDTMERHSLNASLRIRF